jgi:hypothetical protein
MKTFPRRFQRGKVFYGAKREIAAAPNIRVYFGEFRRFF